MIQIANIQAKLDFTMKTIEFDRDPTFEEIHAVQEALANWKQWRIVVSKMVMTTTPYVGWSSWCFACGRSHGNFEVCPNNATWTISSAEVASL